MDLSAKIFLAGHGGLVGRAILKALKNKGFANILTRSRADLDLNNQDHVAKFLRNEQCDVVIDAAARVGGIHANNEYRTEFLYENLQIQNNLIWSSHLSGVKTFVFLGSSCIYPRNAPQPISEIDLLTGELELTNRPYALAKISGLELTSAIRYQYHKNYFSIMPTNLYGPNDNFHRENSHVVPALIRRFHEAKQQKIPEVTVWGSGRPMREFLFVDDCADGVVFLLQNITLASFANTKLAPLKWAHVNLGTGVDLATGDLARLIAKITEYPGKILFDSSKPDGTPRKVLDVSMLKSMGYEAKTTLEQGLRQTYSWFLNQDSLREV